MHDFAPAAGVSPEAPAAPASAAERDPGGLRLRILGPLEASRDGAGVDLGPVKQRAVLALLLLRANHVVSLADLGDALWGDTPPRTARKNIQVYVSVLRGILGPGADEPDRPGPTLLRRPPGYALRVGADGLDMLRFQDLVRAGRRAADGGDAAAAATLLGRAVRLWRGPVLPDLADSAPVFAAEASALRERYLSAFEDWIEAELGLGRHDDVLDLLDEVAGEHPLRERLLHARMTVLYRRGRRTEALARFDEARQLLARELGLPPSPVLSALYAAVLADDASRVDGEQRRARPRATARGRASGPADAGAPVQDRARPQPVDPRPAAAPEPAGLGRDLLDFTGRSGALDALVALFTGTPRGVTAVISGPAGIGKTALAARCAHRLAESFDGRILVRLRTPAVGERPAMDVLAELLRALGADQEGAASPVASPADAAAYTARIRELAAQRRLLIVLDDAGSATQVRSLVHAVGDSAVLVTARRRLDTVEAAAHLALGPLPEPEAVGLLRRLLGPDRVDADPDGIRQLAEACAGSPLALRIAAARLAGLPHLTPARFAGRLADERRTLDELAVGDLDLRFRLADWCRDLPAAQAQAVRRLARAAAPAPSAGFTVDDAAAVLGTDPQHAESVLERLIYAHCLDVCEGGAREDEDEDCEDEVVAHAAPGPVRFALPRLLHVFVRELDRSAPDRP